MAFEDRYGVGESGAVLVRPDGHVAYRDFAGGEPAALIRLLGGVFDAVLQRP